MSPGRTSSSTEQVADVRPPPAASVLASGTEAPVSEHDPHLMEAVLSLDSVVKGTPPHGETVVLFPASIDVAWAVRRSSR